MTTDKKPLTFTPPPEGITGNPADGALIIYHGGGCLDGFAAAWAHNYATSGHVRHRQYFPMDYDDREMPDPAGRNVYLLDFSLPVKDLREVCQRAAVVMVVDHHKAAADALSKLVARKPRAQVPRPKGGLVLDIATFAGDDSEWVLLGDPTRSLTAAEFTEYEYHNLAPDNLACVIDMSLSGGQLTWDTFYAEAGHGFPELDGARYTRPAMLDCLGARDRWAKHEVPDGWADAAASYFASVPKDFTAWTVEMTKAPYQVIDSGRTLNAQFNQLAEVSARPAHIMRLLIGGKVVPAANTSRVFRSEAGYNVLNRDSRAPFAAIFYLDNGRWGFSLRSHDRRDDVDLVARQYGGGGHRNAAGFSVPLNAIQWYPEATTYNGEPVDGVVLTPEQQG